MNIKQLKFLLKETVREVIKEELPVLLLEHQVKLNRLNESIGVNLSSKPNKDYNQEWGNFVNKSSSDIGSFSKPQPVTNKPVLNNLFADLIADAGSNMKPGEVQSML